MVFDLLSIFPAIFARKDDVLWLFVSTDSVCCFPCESGNEWVEVRAEPSESLSKATQGSEISKLPERTGGH